MKDKLIVGLIIADTGEYEPVIETCEEYFGTREDFYSRMGHKFSLGEGGRIIEVRSVLCGIGMVNAAAAAMWLAKDCDILISTGFSGGLWDCAKGDVVLGEQYIEHDFDLTGLGYEPGMKPDQASVYECDPMLLKIFEEQNPGIKTGVMASGDHFVCDTEESMKLRRLWNTVACDMETAAAAYVASLTGRRFIAVRQISDSADDSAVEDYSGSLVYNNKTAFQTVMNGIESFFQEEELWN